MNTVEEIFEKKKQLHRERDLCAEIYNLWITKLHDYQDEPEKYEIYMKQIENLEPYTNTIKAQIRECNRQLCGLLGVDNIEETEYSLDCEYKYGYVSPNG